MSWQLADDLEFEALCLASRMLAHGCMLSDAEAVTDEAERIATVLRRVVTG